MKALKDCEYSAFISYAHADDTLWYQWVSHFRTELEQSLRAQLRGVPVPRMHMSGDNGPVAGRLGEELERRIAGSFAMIIVVGDNYAQSEWCLKELAYFHQLFGEEGLRQRLYIVSLVEGAMHAVAGGRAWQALMPGGEQLWLPFSDPADPTRPLDVYMGPGLVANAFRVPFERLRNDLAAKLKRAAQAVPAAPAPPVAAPAAAPVPAVARPVPVPVAPDSGWSTLPGALPPPAPAARTVWLGFGAPAAQGALAVAAAQLTAAGLVVRRLEPDAVFADFAELEGAQTLILPLDEHPPLMTRFKPGGHLEVQRDAWLQRGKPAEDLLWLDLRPAPDAGGVGAGYLATIGGTALALPALLHRLRPAAAPVPQSVRIYIESNRHERTLWEPLGEQIQHAWDDVCRQTAPDLVPPLSLRARGLPLDDLERFPNLDDADGVVLLWGKKTGEALVAQIDRIEKRIAPGRDAPPGIVAFLMPPQQSSEPMPAWGWQVLRFDARDEDRIDVLDEESGQLHRFLRKVLQRRRQRDAGGRP
jgi:hypothetical protein